MNDQRVDHQAQAIAVLVGHVRPDWQHAGVIAAVRKAMQHGEAYSRPFGDVAVACVRAAADRRNRTPAILGMPGDHWQTTGAQTPGQPPRSSQACLTHPSQFAESCCYCAGLDEQLDDQPDVHELEAAGLTGRALFERVRPRNRQESAAS